MFIEKAIVRWCCLHRYSVSKDYLIKTENISLILWHDPIIIRLSGTHQQIYLQFRQYLGHLSYAIHPTEYMLLIARYMINYSDNSFMIACTARHMNIIFFEFWIIHKEGFYAVCSPMTAMFKVNKLLFAAAMVLVLLKYRYAEGNKRSGGCTQRCQEYQENHASIGERFCTYRGCRCEETCGLFTEKRRYFFFYMLSENLKN